MDGFGTPAAAETDPILQRLEGIEHKFDLLLLYLAAEGIEEGAGEVQTDLDGNVYRRPAAALGDSLDG